MVQTWSHLWDRPLVCLQMQCGRHAILAVHFSHLSSHTLRFMCSVWFPQLAVTLLSFGCSLPSFSLVCLSLWAQPSSLGSLCLFWVVSGLTTLPPYLPTRTAKALLLPVQLPAPLVFSMPCFLLSKSALRTKLSLFLCPNLFIFNDSFGPDHWIKWKLDQVLTVI